jgi:hypothetical protein
MERAVLKRCPSHPGPMSRHPIATHRFGARIYCADCARKLALLSLPVVVGDIARLFGVLADLLVLALPPYPSDDQC